MAVSFVAYLNTYDLRRAAGFQAKTGVLNRTGREIGYNPTKPGRPSHNIHTYWIANLRLVIDAEVQGEKTHPAKYSLPGLIRLLKAQGLAARKTATTGTR